MMIQIYNTREAVCSYVLIDQTGGDEMEINVDDADNVVKRVIYFHKQIRLYMKRDAFQWNWN